MAVPVVVEKPNGGWSKLGQSEKEINTPDTAVS